MRLFKEPRERKKMEWTRTETIALANESCVECRGLGFRTSERRGNTTPCNCVFRAIFRACYARFKECAVKERRMTRATLTFTPGRERRITWGRKEEEYVADFCLIAKRVLTPYEHQIFRYHYLLGADWKLCTRQLKMDRGTFFHAVYRIQKRLGRVFRDLEPYALFPLDEYFSGSTKDGAMGRVKLRAESAKPAGQRPVRPPVARAA
jgi:hypothetical protein